jgi:hypothetical protein
MQSNNNIQEQIANLQAKYYSETSKNKIFKNSQKLDCANSVVQNMDLKVLFSSCIYILPNKNVIFIDYPKLKTFVCPEIYHHVTDYSINLANQCIAKYQVFSLHINMQSFTITAAQRYKELIELYCNTCLHKDSQFQSQLQFIHLYNYPSIIPVLHKMFAHFVDDSARGKLVLEKK